MANAVYYGSFDHLDEALVPTNYRERLHTLLFIEEYERRRQLTRYRRNPENNNRRYSGGHYFQLVTLGVVTLGNRYSWGIVTLGSCYSRPDVVTLEGHYCTLGVRNFWEIVTLRGSLISGGLYS